MATEKLRASIRRLRGPGKEHARMDLAPDTPFEAVLAERMRSLEGNVEELKGRVNGLVFLVVGAVVVQVVMNLMR